MVLRSLVKLSGGQPGPAATWRMPWMKSTERKGHISIQLLLAANTIGGIACFAFCMRYLFVRDRGLSPHVERDTLLDDKGPWLQLFDHQSFKDYATPSSKPDITTFQPLKESGKVPLDH